MRAIDSKMLASAHVEAVADVGANSRLFDISSKSFAEATLSPAAKMKVNTGVDSYLSFHVGCGNERTFR